MTPNNVDHCPVMLEESVALLKPALTRKNDNEMPILIDMTCGCGHHSIGFYKALAGSVSLVCIDCDCAMLAIAKGNFMREGVSEDRFRMFRSNFELVDEVCRNAGVEKADAIFLDLGLNSSQISVDSKRGFSFRDDSALDMRFDDRLNLTAEAIVNTWSVDELRRIFWEYGEEKRAKFLAETIVKKRKSEYIKSARRLAEIIEDATPRKLVMTGRLHSATLVFQSIRVAVNSELKVLETALHKSLALLKPGGRIGVISYHSLEDRIVKNIFRDNSKSCKCPVEQPFCSCGGKPEFKVLTKNPIVPSEVEVDKNPRARSGKLRGIEKIN